MITPYTQLSFDYTLTNDKDEPIPIHVKCDVYEETDPMGTGDSPTQYLVDIVYLDSESGKITEEDLTGRYYDKITQYAIDQYLDK